MDFKSSEDLQEQKRMEFLKARFRTKFIPKKKIKDIQNHELKDIINEHVEEEPSAPKIETKVKSSTFVKKSQKIESKSDNWVVEDEIVPKLSRSAEALRKLLIINVELINFLEFEDEEEVDPIDQQFKKLPSEMRKFPQLKSGSKISIPSLKIPSKSDSAVSPSLCSKLPSSGKTKKTASQISVNHVNFANDEFENDSSNLIKGISTKLDAISSALGKASKEMVQNVVSQPKHSDSDCKDRESKTTIGDLAHKHIVKPLTIRLASFCIKQGELYLEILDDFQKACSEFHQACKDKGL